MRLPCLSLLVLSVTLTSACVESRVESSNRAPEVSILEPAPASEFLPGDEVAFRGAAVDGATNPNDLSLTWSSSRDGVLLEGTPDDEGESTFVSTSLSVGEHTITLRVIDPQGASGTDAITLVIEEGEVPNTPPTCAITAPEDDAELVGGQTLVLEGTVGDAESAPNLLTARWSSSEDGELGTSTPNSGGALALPVDLSDGTHVLTLDVEDPEGLSCSEFVIVQVIPDNFPPSVGAPSITPAPLLTTTDATCMAPAPTDPEGDAVTVALSWQVNGNELGVSAATLASSSFVKGDSVTCTATPSDASASGNPSASTPSVVADTPPTQPGVAVSPAAPVNAQGPLLCSVSAPSSDDDGETITYAVAWTFGGAPYSGPTSQTTLPGDTIAAPDAVTGTWVCTVTPSAGGVMGPAGSASVTVAPPAPVGKIVFLTSTTQNGNLGGVTGADSRCQTRANAAGLSGTFKAWLSGGSASSAPASRFTQSSIPYVRTDGLQIAANWADLTDGFIDYPINVDEFGNVPTGATFVWSYTRIDGTKGLFGSSTEDCYGGDCHCANWTTTQTQGNPTQGSAVARWTYTDDDWTDYSFGNFCGSNYRLYCFQQ